MLIIREIKMKLFFNFLILSFDGSVLRIRTNVVMIYNTTL